jgi:PAS domain S-box-containing protein
MTKTLVTNRLRVLRAERGFTQLEIATKLGVGLTRYWKIENDHVRATPEELGALRQLFLVEKTDIFPDGKTGRTSSKDALTPGTNRLRVLRAERRLTQFETATKTGIELTRYWKIENDQAPATPEELKALRQLFRVEKTDIFPARKTGRSFSKNALTPVTNRLRILRAGRGLPQCETAASPDIELEQSRLGVYIMQDDRLVYVNPPVQEITGYSCEELLAMPSALDLADSQDRELAAEKLRQRLNGEVETVDYVVRVRRKEGDTVRVRVVSGVIDYAGRRAVIGTVLDMTSPHGLESPERNDAPRRNRSFSLPGPTSPGSWNCLRHACDQRVRPAR